MTGTGKTKADLPGREAEGVSEEAGLTQQQMLGMSLPGVQLQLCTQRPWEEAVLRQGGRAVTWPAGLCPLLSHRCSSQARTPFQTPDKRLDLDVHALIPFLAVGSAILLTL